jgi:oligo-1,6-glucosidase
VDVAENDPNSILHYYRKMIAYRKANLTLVYGDYEDLLPKHPYLFVYKRWDNNQEFLVLHNFRDDKTPWKLDNPNYTLQHSNYTVVDLSFLSPWESRVYRLG